MLFHSIIRDSRLDQADLFTNKRRGALHNKISEKSLLTLSVPKADLTKGRKLANTVLKPKSVTIHMKALDDYVLI